MNNIGARESRPHQDSQQACWNNTNDGATLRRQCNKYTDRFLVKVGMYSSRQSQLFQVIQTRMKSIEQTVFRNNPDFSSEEHCVYDENEIAMLLRLGLDANNGKGKGGWTLLHYASRENNLNLIKILLDHGSDINLSNNHGYTSLHVACSRGNLDAAKLLIEMGADLHTKSYYGSYTVLHSAVEHYDIMELLVDNGGASVINFKDDDGLTPLHYACGLHRYMDPKLAKLLLDHGADFESKTNDGDTALHYACDFGPVDCVQILLESGANILCRNNSNKTPVEDARSEHIVQLIQDEQLSRRNRTFIWILQNWNTSSQELQEKYNNSYSKC